jgi:hypothetical protein
MEMQLVYRSCYQGNLVCHNIKKAYDNINVQEVCNVAQNLLGCTAMFLTECRSTFQLRARQYIPENSELHTRHRENLKSHKSVTCYMQHIF